MRSPKFTLCVQYSPKVLDEVCEDDVTAVTHFLDPHWSSEQKLWFAVIENAIIDVEYERESESAVSWLLAPDEDVGHFRWAVALFDIDPDQAQRSIRRCLDEGKMHVKTTHRTVLR